MPTAPEPRPEPHLHESIHLVPAPEEDQEGAALQESEHFTEGGDGRRVVAVVRKSPAVLPRVVHEVRWVAQDGVNAPNGQAGHDLQAIALVSWKAACRSVEWFAERGLARRESKGVKSMRVDEIHWGQDLRASNFLTLLYQIDAHCQQPPFMRSSF